MFKLKKELTNIEKVIFYRQNFWGGEKEMEELKCKI